MKETATQRMLKAYLNENPGEPSGGVYDAAIHGESDAFIARKVVSELGDEFSVADIRNAIAGDPEPMTCPCCGSDDTAGVPRFQVICWSCFALFRETPGGVHMVECMCGRHDNGRIVKSATREEV